MNLIGSNFHVTGCNVTVADDNIAMLTNDTVVEDCFFGGGHGASIGSMCNRYIRNVTVRNVAIRHTPTGYQRVGLRIKTNPHCAGYVRDVTYENIYIEQARNAIEVDALYGHRGPLPLTTLTIRDVTYRNVTGVRCRSPGFFSCDPSSPCVNIRMEHVDITSSYGRFTCSNAYGQSQDVYPSSCLLPGTPTAPLLQDQLVLTAE
mmetsp:Transcript_23385/g.40245  ORF Transcript_23385/g.40245 Transcript_23385/m.40245 type:complete len:204 (+) Transcript_23385:606-1217(+)